MNIKKFFIELLQSGKPQFPVRKSVVAWAQYLIRYLAFIVLLGCSLGYRGVVQLRVYLYQAGVFKRFSLPCPVISIGNITAGGTGKTPAVIEIAKLLRQHGKRVAILSRGYRRNTSMPNYVVQPDADVRMAGDEPLLIARKLQSQKTSNVPNIPVIVGSQRYLSGKLALDRFQSEVILLDDGFQHIQLERTFDLVLIDATNPFGGGYMLPAGFLREPLTHLARAHAFVITRSDEIDDLAPIKQQLQQFNPDAPIFRGVHACDEIKHVITGEIIEIDSLKKMRLLAVSGLANPASFFHLLDSSGLSPIENLAFPDHHWYTRQDAIEMRRIISEQDIDAVIATEKDEAKLAPYVDIFGVLCCVVTIRLEIQPQKEFENFLLLKL